MVYCVWSPAMLARISQRGWVHRGPGSEKIVLQERFVSEAGGSPMQTECSADLFGFAPVEGRAVVAAFDGGKMTSEAGAMLLGATDRTIRLVERFAGCFSDHRTAELVEHTVARMVGQRVFGIALGYEDLIDHDQLRHDPVMAVLGGKLESKRSDCAPLAGKSTLNRLELSRAEPSRYHKISYDAARIEAVFVDVFLDAHAAPPSQITLDLDATDDPLHGRQEGRFFHGYYDNYCSLPLYVFCGRHLLVSKLRPADIDASAGSVEEVAQVVARIRQRWPAVLDDARQLEPPAPRRRQGGMDRRPSQSAFCRHLAIARGARGPAPLREALLRARRDGEPDQGMSARPLCRPHLGQNDARQPVAAVVCLDGLGAAVRLAPHRPRPPSVRPRLLRHHPPQAAKDWCPGAHQRAPHQARHAF